LAVRFFGASSTTAFGARPFGFQITGEGKQKRLVPNAAEQAAAARMIALKAEGKSLRAIAAEIAASGFDVSHMAVKKALAQAMADGISG
jgi:putative DNA-invertase from lambdoid prophage Rac